MPAPNPDIIAWIDVETTGLDPAREHLLEISLILTDNELDPVADPVSVLIDPSVEDVHPDYKVGSDIARTVSDFIRDMHTSNGLFADLDAGLGVAPDEADGLIADAIDAAAGEGGKPLLAGNSITLDRNFLEAQAPRTYAALHYRSIDVTSIENDLARDGFAEPIAEWHAARPKKSHRGADDIRDSIDQLRALRRIRRGEAA